MMRPIRYDISLKLETGTHTSRVNQLLVSRDGRTLVTAGEKTIRVWDVETRKPLRMLSGQIGTGSDGVIQRIALSRDDRYVVAVAWWNPGKTHDEYDRHTDLQVFELATGNLKASFRFSGTLYDLDFSPDGEYLAIVGSPKKPGRRRYLQVCESSVVLRGVGTALTPVASHSLDENADSALEPVHVRFVSRHPEDGAGAQIVVAAAVRHPNQDPEYSGGLFWYSFSGPGSLKKLPASRNTEENLVPAGLAVSQEFVVVTGNLKKFFCLDHTGQLASTILTENVPAAPAFSRNGKQLIVGQRGDSALVEVCAYDSSVAPFHLKSTYHGHDSEVAAVGFLSDSKAVSAGGDENSMHFWDPSHFEGEQTGIIKGVGRAIHAVGINSDEEIGIGNYDGLHAADGGIVLQRVFKLQSMTLHALSVHEAAGFQRARTSAGGKRLELESREGQETLRMQPGNQALAYGTRAEGYDITTYGFTPNGAVVAGTSDGTLQVGPRGADGRNVPVKRYLKGHTAAPLDHAASGNWLVTGGADQVIRLWYVPDVEQDSTEALYPALNLFVGSDDEWVIWSKSGYYNASQRGDRRFGYQVNRGPDKEALFFSSDRFISALFRLDVIQAIAKYGSEERALEELAKQGRPVAPLKAARMLPPIVELLENGIITTKDKIKLAFTAETLSPRKPVKRAWIVQNERLAWESPKPRKKYTVTLPLLPGRNRIKILAENKSAKSPPLIHTVMGPPAPESDRRRAAPKVGSPSRGVVRTAPGTTSEMARPPKKILLGDGANAVPDNGILYLLAVGVSTLKKQRPDQGYKNLQFADDDAMAIYNAFATKKRLTDTLQEKELPLNRAFQSVEATILLNEQATKAAIEKAVHALCVKIRTRSRKVASQRDVLLVFLSGHGVQTTDSKTHEQYLYFWNHDFNFDHIRRTGLSLISLGKEITSIPADVILATDACHSGMAGSDVARGLDPNELAKRIYAINERGLYILSAARSQELAIESDRPGFKHGVFTKSILETLQHDRSVSMMELIASVQQRVDYYTSHKQTPICRTYGDLLPLVIYQR